jgi:hypothetical protein
MAAAVVAAAAVMDDEEACGVPPLRPTDEAETDIARACNAIRAGQI